MSGSNAAPSRRTASANIWVDHPAHLMGTRDRTTRARLQTSQALILIAAQPRMDRLPRDTPTLGDLTDRHTLSQHRQRRLVLLLLHAELPDHEGVSRRNRSHRQATTEPLHSRNPSHSVKEDPGLYSDVEPPVGIEPTTYSLRVNRSTD